MKKYIWTLLLVSITFSLSAQSYTTLKTASKKETKRYNEAKDDAFAGDYMNALKELDKLLTDNETFINAWILKGQIHFDQKQFEPAEQALKKAIAIDPSYNDLVYYILGIASFDQEQFDLAANWFDEYEKQSPVDQRRRQQARQYAAQSRVSARLLANPVPFDPKPMSDAINSPFPEYLPSLTADESMFIFTRQVQGQEDFFAARRNEDGSWQDARPLSRLNTPQNEGAQTVSADGHLLVFAAGDRRDSYGGFDLYFSEFINGEFTPPINMGNRINTRARDRQPSLSGDGKYLYFESARSGGLGGGDIWVSERQSDGSWGNPKNLGAPINTSADDQSPFIHADGKTLYFMSKGHPGMGGFDLFVSRKQADGSWSEPENIGYPINTKANEGALFVALDGRTAYYTSNQRPPEYGGREDIYTFQLPEAARPSPITYVRAIVRDARTRQRIPNAKAEITDLASSKLHSTAYTNEQGTFLNTLPVGTDYALNVSAEGYLFHSENFALSEELEADEAFVLEVLLEPIPTEVAAEGKARPIILKNVFFSTNETTITPASTTELERLYQLLVDQPNLRIQINGHTDDVGSEEDNQQLSEGRAKAVYEYLMNKGIATSRLKYKGFGESLPIASNDTDAGRQQNRRTEFVVLLGSDEGE
jgi:outer membrane protein OmpA-like peptidoglycan-associated protein